MERERECYLWKLKWERERERERESAVSVSQNGERERVLSLEVKMRERERERESAVSVSQNGENEFLEDESIYRQSLCGWLQMCRTKSKLQMELWAQIMWLSWPIGSWDWLVYRCLPSLFHGTSGIMAILKYRSINPIPFLRLSFSHLLHFLFTEHHKIQINHWLWFNTILVVVGMEKLKKYSQQLNSYKLKV